MKFPRRGLRARQVSQSVGVKCREASKRKACMVVACSDHKYQTIFRERKTLKPTKAGTIIRKKQAAEKIIPDSLFLSFFFYFFFWDVVGFSCPRCSVRLVVGGVFHVCCVVYF